jgi:SDR family mycofactocin-dependent oxidoreductase
MSEGRVALITGAARGIGAAVARTLASEGWRLVLVDACADDPALDYPLGSAAELDSVAAEVGGIAVRADVRVQAELDAAVDVAITQFGGLDAAVAAAGVIWGGREVWHTPDDAWRAVMGTDLDGVWHLARAAVPALLARPEPRQGRFVAVASVAGMTGLPMMGAYSAAKHGVIGLVRSLAAELGPLGVTANAVAPGSTSTRILEASAEVYGLSTPDEFAHHHLLPRLIEPAEVAALIAWLAGPASSAVTGAVLPVDAGMSAH